MNAAQTGQPKAGGRSENGHRPLHSQERFFLIGAPVFLCGIVPAVCLIAHTFHIGAA